MIIYRVEHKKHDVGPYRAWEVSNKLDSSYWMKNNHGAKCRPNAYDEGWIREERHLFGFKTINQLKRWFTKRERMELKKLGFVVKQYKIVDYEISSYQVMFNGDDKELLKVLDMID